MKIVCIGGRNKNNPHPQLETDFFFRENCQKLLFIGFHSSKGEEASFEKFLENHPKLREYSDLFSRERWKNGEISLSEYDALVIPGGFNEPICEFLDENPELRREVSAWFESSQSKLFIGNSAGSCVLGRKYISSFDEKNIPYDPKRYEIFENGLNIFFDAIFDPHLEEWNKEERFREIFKNHKDIKIAYRMSENSIIIFNARNQFQPELFFGNVVILKK